MNEKQVRELVLDLIKSSLVVRVYDHREIYTGDGVKVELELNGEVISSDSIVIIED